MDLRDDYVSVDECAERMNLTAEQVWDLIAAHALRAYRWAGWGEVLVQPALLTGAVTTRGRDATVARVPKRRGR